MKKWEAFTPTLQLGTMTWEWSVCLNNAANKSIPHLASKSQFRRLCKLCNIRDESAEEIMPAFTMDPLKCKCARENQYHVEFEVFKATFKCFIVKTGLCVHSTWLKERWQLKTPFTKCKLKCVFVFNEIKIEKYETKSYQFILHQIKSV